jgi:EPTP domain
VVSVILTEAQRIPTSGARAAEPVPVAGFDLLAIPQLARDIPGGPPGMNGGDSDTDLLLFRRAAGQFMPWATLPAPGGEDAEFFTIGDRSFLAVASIRTGAGPYDFETASPIFEWQGGRFVPFQDVPTFAAKQWRHWEVDGRHFLGLAQGVIRPPGHGGPAGHAGAGEGGAGEGGAGEGGAGEGRAANRDSVVYEWTGESFTEFQRIPSRWAYNWHAFRAGGEFFVAHAEHAGPSVLYRWDGARLTPHQTLAAESGRAFATFPGGDGDDGATVLVVACIAAPSRVLRLEGKKFTETQVLDGLGARELKVARCGGQTLLIRVNFILGTPADPQPALDSQVYAWDGGKLHEVATFPTCGGTDVAVIPGEDNDSVELIVTNSLTPELRFAAQTVRYELRAGAR